MLLKFGRLLLAGSALAALRPAFLHAQGVDYTGLEQVFGEPITTSVSGKPQRASEVPADLSIITQDDIRRSGADNIPDILQFVTGIDIRQYGFGDKEVAVRGYNSGFNPRLLVMVDGRQIYADDYGRVPWNAIPVQLGEIRQIEVVKGPNSALFGFNAASGVINIITYDPLLDKVNTATIRGGTQAYGAGSAVGTAHIGETAGLRISAGGWTANEFSGATNTAGIAAPRNATVNLDGRWQVTSNILLRASAGQTDSHAPTVLPQGNYSIVENRIGYLRLGAVADTRIGTVDADIYHNKADYTIGGFTSTNDVTSAKLSDLLKVNADNTVRAGFEYRNNRSSGQAFLGRLSYEVYSADALWDWQLAPSVELTNAIRLDHLVLNYSGTLLPVPGRTQASFNDQTITQPSFNSGIVVKVSDQDTVRLTAARGLQVPSLIDLGLQLSGPGLTLVGTPTLVPTSVWNTELAYDRTLPSLGATATVGVFFQRNTDLIAPFGNTPFTFANRQLLSISQNIGSSNEIGAEFGLRGKTAGGFRWNASYRYASITDDITHPIASFANQLTKYADGTPQHTIILGAGYTIDRWEMDAAARWQSSYTDYENVGPSFQPVVASNYVALNARVGYQLTKNVILSGTAQQFNISQLLKPTGSLVERRFFASATLNF